MDTHENLTYSFQGYLLSLFETSFNTLSSFLSGISGSDSTGSSSYSDQQGDRYKRRRMLQFTGANTGGFPQDSPPPYEVIGSPTTTYSSHSSYTSSYSVRHLSSPRISIFCFCFLFCSVCFFSSIKRFRV